MLRRWIRFFKLHQSYLPILGYGILSLAILSQLLLPGHILTLDSTQIFNPDTLNRFFGLDQGAMASSPGIPFDFFNFFFATVISFPVFEKIVLFLIFFLSGLGAYRLFPRNRVGAYFAGILYTINPFTYTRFLAGQWGVLWAYAIFPFAVKSFIDLLQTPSRKNAATVALFFTLTGMLQLQGFFLLIIVFIIFLAIYIVGQRKKALQVRNILKATGISAALAFVLNLYWLVPAITAKGTLLSQISNADLLLFAPKPQSVFGISFDIASMYGFWRGGYIYAKDIVPFWWIIFLFILFLVVFGTISRFKEARDGWKVVSLVTIGIISFMLALGAASPYTSPVFDWLWNHFPFFRAFRDSQKFVALICLSYAILGGLGTNEFFTMLGQSGMRLTKIGLSILIVACLFAPIVYSLTMFGFYQQVKVSDYPNEWSDANNYLNADKTDFNVLFLPWHEYMDYTWLNNQDKRLSNPAQQFFAKPIIAGDNMESGNIYSQSTNPISKYIEFLLNNKGDISNFGELLAPLNVKYVILVNEADYTNYNFLYSQKDLTVALNRPGITIFQNQHPTTRGYSVNNVEYIRNLGDYLNLSQTQDVMDHVYVIGDGIDSGSTAQLSEVATKENSPIYYGVGTSNQKYFIFTVPQNVSTENWKYNGQVPTFYNLGFMPVFESSANPSKVVYIAFYYQYLPSYIVSGLALILIFWWIFQKSLSNT